MGQLVKDFVTLQTPVEGGGSGNGTVTVSANSDNTGRGARNVDVTFSASGITYTRSISQAGKPEFVTIESVKAVDKAGATTVSISGTSNSKKLTFAISSGATLELVLPASYIANSVTTNNGVDISGDPGNQSTYNYSIAFSNVDENLTIDPKTAQLVVTDNYGHTATCNITQAAGDPSLSVTPNSVQLDWNASTTGTTASFTVTSNTNWTVV